MATPPISPKNEHLTVSLQKPTNKLLDLSAKANDAFTFGEISTNAEKARAYSAGKLPRSLSSRALSVNTLDAPPAELRKPLRIGQSSPRNALPASPPLTPKIFDTEMPALLLAEASDTPRLSQSSDSKVSSDSSDVIARDTLNLHVSPKE